MASYSGAIEEDLTCCVCFELFVDPHTPKDLRCPHVICELCLNRLVKDSSIDCPLCHKITRVSKDGVAALRTNLVIRNLAVTHQKHLDKKKRQSHLSSRQSRHDGTVPVCSVHDDEKLHLYCITCDVLACHVCVLLHHERPEHQIKDVKTVYGEHVKTMDAAMNRLTNEAALCEKKSQELCKTEQMILSSINKEVDEIDKAVELLVLNAYKEGNTLKTELKNIRDLKLKDCNRQKLTLQKQADGLRRAVTDTEAIVRDTSSHNFVILHKALAGNLKALDGQTRYEELVQYTPCELKFKRAEQLSVKLGEIAQVHGKASSQQVVQKKVQPVVKKKVQQVVQKKVQQVVQKKKSAKDVIRKIHLSAQLPDVFHEPLQNIALNITGEIVALSKSDMVTIFHKESSESDLYIKGTVLDLNERFLAGNCNTTIAPVERILVTQGKSIHAYLPPEMHHRVLFESTAIGKDWQAGEKFECITTTADGKIIVGCCEKLTIVLLAPDGKLMKTIGTGNASINPECITAINNTHVAIADSRGVVGVFDIESDERGYSIFRISSSIHGRRFTGNRPICYDNQTDCLLIGNQPEDGSGVIEQYSFPTGRLVGCIVQWKTCVPRAIALSGDGSMLAVAFQGRSGHYGVMLYAVAGI